MFAGDQGLIIPEESKLDPVELLKADSQSIHSSHQSDGIDSVSLTSELDTISIETCSSSSSRPHSRAWGPDRLLGVKELGM